MLEDHRPIRIAGVAGETTFSEFLAANADGIDLDEALEIQGALDRQGFYRGGGGAAAEWRIDVVRSARCPSCSNRGWVPSYRAPMDFSLSLADQARANERERTAPRLPCPARCEAVSRLVCEAA
ncbi:MAG TPA: hypothetical protein VG248_03615 [Caulobacteraceae bacterium]|jgi:hypothetical protein|nr:hypothetical protein [Caulobacteraceae bacterium]